MVRHLRWVGPRSLTSHEAFTKRSLTPLSLWTSLDSREIALFSCATYEATNTGPGGTGHAVRFDGWEQWILDHDGRIEASDGWFDTAEYERQLAHGV